MSRLPAWLAAVVAASIVGCASLPPPEGRSVTSALADTDGTRLALAVVPRVVGHPGKAGIFELPEPDSAFAARILLAAEAERSLDVQYYIWHGDQTGMLLFEALWRAAERGVRVRLLLDDINTGGQDATLAALAAHPNLELRLYNPRVYRSALAVNFLVDFTRVNRRMHNKSFTADNQVAVVGGRNVGNEYFGAGDDVVFDDLDVMVVGPVVRDISRAFDLYWNSASAYPAAGFVGAAAPDAAARLEAGFAATRADPQSVVYIDAVRQGRFVRELVAGRLPLEWAYAQLVRDDPAKTLDASGRTDVLLLPDLLRTLGRPAQEFDLVSPYFVPGDGGTIALAELARSGVRVRVLTNSLATSDVSAVHAGYAKRRHDLLRAGVRLYELKPAGTEAVRHEKRKLGRFSSASLHAKTFAVDRSRIFVGSFNFDQRSARLNTEMGLVLDSPRLAGQLAAFFDNDVPDAAFEVRLAPDGETLVWIERTPSGDRHWDTEPETSWFRRAGVGVMSLLPIEWLL